MTRIRTYGSICFCGSLWVFCIIITWSLPSAAVIITHTEVIIYFLAASNFTKSSKHTENFSVAV